MLTIVRETPDRADIHRLLGQADARSAALYPAESRFGATAAELILQNVRFFLARDFGTAVGCGGFVVGADRCGELKRVFVIPEARGRSIGRRIVEAVEHAARAEHVPTLLIETGVASVEALSLYRRLGYAERGPFWSYGSDPLSVFLEKPLTRSQPPPSVAAPVAP